MGDADHLGPWVPLDPVEVRHLLRGFDRPWWISGGWALDMFLGRKTRQHEDTDVEFLHRDALAAQAIFATWDLQWALSGELTPWPVGATPTPEQDSVWARPTSDSAWALQLMFSRGDDRTWIYKRNPSVTRPLDDVIRHTGDGIPYLAPEVQLLYKSKTVRPKDQADFHNVAPELDDPARAWLREHLTSDHPWKAALSEA